MYSISCYSCSFEREIIKIGQSSHKMYSNNILNFQESKTIFKCPYEKSQETYGMHLVSELLKVDTANWLSCPLKYEVFDKCNASATNKVSELPCLGQQN